MESWTDFCSRSLVDKIVHYLTECTYENFTAFKVNNRNLAVNGEFYFINNFNAWKRFVFEQLLSKSGDWPIRIQRCSLQKEKICVYLNRMDVIPNIIKTAISCDNTFGRIIANDKVFNLRYQSDTKSDLTTQRLRLIRSIIAKVMDLHGYRISDEDCNDKYIFTSRSKGSIEDGYERYVCGVVKNIQSNTKEIHATWEQCIKDRMDYLNNNYHYMFNCEENEDNVEKYLILCDMAHAIIIFDLISVAPRQPVVIEYNICKSSTYIRNTKGASFVLYNTARIARIIAKYNMMVLCGEFPPLPNIDDVDFSQLQQEEEWELIYNFIFGYPQMLQNCLRYKPNFQIYPQVICTFLSELCQKFSSYYGKTKILMGGSVHLAPKMFARLYMLQALQVVLSNALSILDIKPVSQM
ncbi:DALR anticodon-binding domain-containing protein 3 [Harpegnathos saltator]|uniref:DALR anticodon-binding domain-containing protein 3 n=1 Tax=Harpegnathos saltator TaxID=610380 RepID=E2BHF5_HARSA|nr:DALR anticodon-binding domain-containing protein 3 [Harpegnathos saltator]